MSGRGPSLPGSRGTSAGTAIRLAVVAAIFAALFAVALVLDLGPFEEDSLSRGQFIARADQVCATARDAFAELQAQPLQTAEQSADVAGRLADIARDESAQLEALDGLPELDAQMTEYLRVRERAIELIDRGRAAAERDDPEAYERAQTKLAASQGRRARLARAFGSSACSRPLASRGGLARQAEPLRGGAG